VSLLSETAKEEEAAVVEEEEEEEAEEEETWRTSWRDAVRILRRFSKVIEPWVPNFFGLSFMTVLEVAMVRTSFYGLAPD
jgi:hypothetical protein